MRFIMELDFDACFTAGDYKTIPGLVVSRKYSEKKGVDDCGDWESAMRRKALVIVRADMMLSSMVTKRK